MLENDADHMSVRGHNFFNVLSFLEAKILRFYFTPI